MFQGLGSQAGWEGDHTCNERAQGSEIRVVDALYRCCGHFEHQACGHNKEALRC